MGTLYRHFPTKEELIDAVLEDAFAELVRCAEKAATNEDGWAGFTGFLEEALALHAANLGLKDVLVAREHGGGALRRCAGRCSPCCARRSNARKSRARSDRISRPRIFRSCSGRRDA